jgi:hypothetical protein
LATHKYHHGRQREACIEASKFEARFSLTNVHVIRSQNGILKARQIGAVFVAQ